MPLASFVGNTSWPCVAAVRRLAALLALVGALACSLWAGLSQASVGAVANAAPPAAAAAQFYRWYLARLVASADPLRDDAAAMARQVSPVLLREIARRMASPQGMEADYFLQAQDYLDDWAAQVSTQVLDQRGNVATVVVQLGAASPPWRLTVALVRDQGRWLIRRVDRKP